MAKTTKEPIAAITVAEWHDIHPYSTGESEIDVYLVFDTDQYNVSVANRILKELKNNILVRELTPRHIIRRIALIAAGYFEDVISGLGLFDGFRKIHLSLYNRPLPFLDPVDYLDDEINIEDVKFLVWTVLQENQNEIFSMVAHDKVQMINIESGQIELISQLTYTVLSKEYETAPENEKLRDLLHAYTADKPFIFFRKLVKWLH